MTLQRVQGILAVLIASAMLAVGCSSSSSTQKNKDKGGSGGEKKSEEKEDKSPPITVSAEELAREFKTDSAAADQKYKGHTLIIEGKVHDVAGKEISNEPTLILWGYRDKPTDVARLVQCFFPTDLQAELKSYKKGQKVKVKGKGAGSIDTIHYQVKDCTFIKD